MTGDLVNGLFEFIGGLTIWANVRQLHRDKQLKGVRVSSTVFFTSWGLWNLYYYPSLGQWWSFAGGISIALANVTWVGLAIYYVGGVWRQRRLFLRLASHLRSAGFLSEFDRPQQPSA